MAISILQNENYLEEAMFEGVTSSPKNIFQICLYCYCINFILSYWHKDRQKEKI